MRTQSTVNTCKWLEVQENVCDQVLIGFSSASDWLRRGCKFLHQSQSIVKQNQCNPGPDYFQQSRKNRSNISCLIHQNSNTAGTFLYLAIFP